MGCDIHMITQVRTKHGEDNWLRAARFYPCTMCHGTGLHDEGDAFVGAECTYCHGAGRTDGYGQRGYKLFSILAGVRSDGTEEPISPPRGLPPGISNVASPLDDEYWLGDHSFSHLTLGELKLNAHRWASDHYDWADFCDALTLFAAHHRIADHHIRIVFGFDS